MGISIEWENDEKSIIRQVFVAPWTWDEFYDVNAKQIPALMATVDHEVFVISDFLHGAVLPHFGSAVRHAANAMQHYPDNWGLLVVVSDNMLIKILVKTFQKLNRNRLGQKTIVTDSIAAAQQRIDQQRRVTKP